ncbi:MAG: glycosyltransferase family 4 protein [Mycoplasmatales bacterium]
MLIYYTSSFFITLIIVFIIQKVAIKLKVVDKPNYRKVHEQPKALLGGLAVYLSILLIYSIHLGFSFNNETKYLVILAGILMLLGLYDDIFDLKAIYKLIGQLIIAFLTAYFVGGINRIEVYGYVINFTLIQGILIETFWIVALINAFNLIDGLDGLSSGVGILSLMSLVILGMINNDSTSIMFIMIMIGSLLGFLYYNFNPATIFLGDSGSMLIGYLIAIISMNSYKTVTLTSMMLLMLIAFMPFFDVFLAIVRRKANKQKAFEADSLHFHHRLMLKGYSHAKAVFILYFIMTIYSLIAIFLELTTNFYIKLGLTGFMMIVTIFIFEKLYLLSDKYAYITKTIKKVTCKKNKKDM